MKYTPEQQKAIKEGHILNFKVKGKCANQIGLQYLIDLHWHVTEPEKYEIVESKMNAL